MRFRWITVTIVALTALGCTAPPSDAQTVERRGAGTITVSGGTLINGTDSAQVARATIVIRDGRVAEVRAEEDANRPTGTEDIDARGKWIVPGLIRRSQTLGTLEIGKTGDLLVLGADPLVSIGAIRQIEVVIRDGRVVWRR